MITSDVSDVEVVLLIDLQPVPARASPPATSFISCCARHVRIADDADHQEPLQQIRGSAADRTSCRRCVDRNDREGVWIAAERARPLGHHADDGEFLVVQPDLLADRIETGNSVSPGEWPSTMTLRR